MNVEYNALHHLPCLANIKDISSKFIGFTDKFAKLLGWKTSEAALGKTDYDIPCPLATFADEFVKLDREVLVSKKKMLALDIQEYATGWRYILAEKNPIFNQENELIGIYSHCTDVSDVALFRSYVALNQFDETLLNKSKNPTSYILSDCHSSLDLTQKQQIILFFIIRGKSIKEIAKIRNLSSRTVECHLDAIKTKLDCATKSMVIEKAIGSGFLYHIPEILQHEQLDNAVKSIIY